MVLEGQPTYAEQRQRLIQRFEELRARWNDDREGPDAAAIESELARLAHAVEDITPGSALSRCLLASFVHPEPSGRCLLGSRGRKQAGCCYWRFCLPGVPEIPDPAAVEERVEDTVSAICEAIKDRQFRLLRAAARLGYTRRDNVSAITATSLGAGWGPDGHDRSHRCGDRAVGLNPVFAIIPGHIFIGYWRRDPSERPGWYPDRPVIGHPDQDDLV